MENVPFINFLRFASKPDLGQFPSPTSVPGLCPILHGRCLFRGGGGTQVPAEENKGDGTLNELPYFTLSGFLREADTLLSVHTNISPK